MKLLRLPAIWLLTILPLLLLFSCGDTVVEPASVNVSNESIDLKCKYVELSQSEKFSDTVVVNTDACKKVFDLHILIKSGISTLKYRELNGLTCQRRIETYKYKQ
jgi:hypothetical protein